MTEVTLSVKNLHKTIGRKEIIKGLNFELKEGEVFGFLGPNGAGKTTTIRMLTGLIKPTEGTISICGYDVRKAVYEGNAIFRLYCGKPRVISVLIGLG